MICYILYRWYKVKARLCQALANFDWFKVSCLPFRVNIRALYAAANDWRYMGYIVQKDKNTVLISPY